MWKKSEQFDLIFFGLLQPDGCRQSVLCYFLIFINNQGKQHKIQRKRRFATVWLRTACAIIFFCAKEKLVILFYAIFIYFIFSYFNFSVFFIFINNQGKQRKMLKTSILASARIR